MDRRQFVWGASSALALGSVWGGARARAAVDVDVVELSLAEASARLSSGAITARALTQAYLARIEAIDGGGPALRSVIEVNPEALARASALDAERKAGRVRGPLHGVPVLLKDNIDTADKMKTTAGSLALVDAPVPKADAPVAKRLREAGCVMLGKTNLSEWANYRSTRSSSGWSARGGQTKNPYALDRTPCGSSAGSAVAVAASLCAAAIGTETWGSIQCPSAVNGIVGIKPTVGLLSSEGIIPVAHTFDTAGPMARSVRDAALVFAALAPTVDVSASTQQTAPPALMGARVGVTRSLWGGDGPRRALLEEGVRAIAAAGGVVVDAEIEDGETYIPAVLDVLAFEFKADLARYLARRGAKPRGVGDLIAFNDAHAKDELSLFGQELFIDAARRGGLGEHAYRIALRKIEILRKEVASTFAQHRLDAFFGPVTDLPWLVDHVRGDDFDPIGSSMCVLAGCPIVVVPGGAIRGLPFAFSFEGPVGADARVIALARAFEDVAPARIPPTYAPQTATR